MIEASQIKVDPHVAATVKRNQKMSRTKGGSTQKFWPWIRMVGRSEQLLRPAQPQIVVKLNL